MSNVRIDEDEKRLLLGCQKISTELQTISLFLYGIILPVVCYRPVSVSENYILPVVCYYPVSENYILPVVCYYPVSENYILTVVCYYPVSENYILTVACYCMSLRTTF